jgi:dipeptidyl aminopeptidase/acylaminoacyl peptidase
VLFSHGLHGDPADLTPLLSRWAGAGFVVVAPAYPHTSRGAPRFDLGDVLNQPADASFVLTKTLAGALSARIDPAQIAATGHSAGGITTVGLFTVGRDERLRAGIVFAGAAIGFTATFAGPAAPLLFVHGDADDVVSYTSGKAVFDRAPGPKALLTLPGGGHSAPYVKESDPAYRVVAASTADFLRYALYGDPGARGRLAADAKPAGQLDDRL